MSMEVFSAIFLVAIAAVPIGVLISLRRPNWGITHVYKASTRARLPITSDEMWWSIRRRSRNETRASMWGLLIAVAIVGTLFAFTQLKSSPYFIWILVLMIFVVTAVTSTLASTRERLFSPAPQAARIARARELDVSDYLSSVRQYTPRVLLIAAGVAFTVLCLSAFWKEISIPVIVGSATSLALALVATWICRVTEKRILACPQPATNTLELGWDDLFRTDSLNNLRMVAAMTAWLPFGIALTALTNAWIFRGQTDLEQFAGLFPWWGILLLQVVYVLGAGRLSPALFPEYLNSPQADLSVTKEIAK
ncbi:hypothetical protein [Microbacterium marmarense]|uniref:Uncharacterized protein n=1 Tax=Microbacterium marmarense TaxID=3122051 RepID=A0ABU8LUG4_9MICO